MMNTISDFMGDAEKMFDFVLLGKEDFLASYSYLTEEEYDLTAHRVLSLVRRAG